MSWVRWVLHEHHHHLTSCAHDPVFWKWLQGLKWTSSTQTYCDPIRGEPGRALLTTQDLERATEVNTPHNSTCFYCPCQQPSHHIYRRTQLPLRGLGTVSGPNSSYKYAISTPLKTATTKKLNVSAVTRKHQELWECKYGSKTLNLFSFYNFGSYNARVPPDPGGEVYQVVHPGKLRVEITPTSHSNIEG